MDESGEDFSVRSLINATRASAVLKTSRPSSPERTVEGNFLTSDLGPCWAKICPSPWQSQLKLATEVAYNILGDNLFMSFEVFKSHEENICFLEIPEPSAQCTWDILNTYSSHWFTNNNLITLTCGTRR